MSDEKTYTPEEINERLQGALAKWRLQDGMLYRSYACANWRSSVMLFNGIAHVAEAAWHHPDVEVSWSKVRVHLMTHSAKGITDKDFQLASKIEEIAQWTPDEDSALDGTPTDPRWRYRKLESTDRRS